MPEELEEKILSLLQNSPEGFLLQSELWKSLKSGSREVSRSLAKMERRSLVKRESYREGGRKTYKVILLKKRPKIDLSDVLWCSCFTCSDLSRCGMGQPINPEMCTKLSMSLRNEYRKIEKENEQKKAESGKDKDA
ncbi:MAG: hypothetical protein LUP94_01425 [Candidatus Methanomethylicus sp.]|nr:hypothetical protein [Candidatus Methanomethylicus sp.]